MLSSEGAGNEGVQTKHSLHLSSAYTGTRAAYAKVPSTRWELTSRRAKAQKKRMSHLGHKSTSTSEGACLSAVKECNSEYITHIHNRYAGHHASRSQYAVRVRPPIQAAPCQ